MFRDTELRLETVVAMAQVLRDYEGGNLAGL
jgi:hypothetical protein